MRTAHLSLATALAMATGCGGGRLEQGPPPVGADAAVPEAGPWTVEADAAPDQTDAAPDPSDAAPEVAPLNPIDPEVSRRWTWHACGKIVPAGVDSEAVYGADGTLVVRGGDGMTRSYDEKGVRRPETEGPVASLITAPDSTALVLIETPASLVARPIGAATARFTFGLPPSTACGKQYAFSNTGDYFLAHGKGASCIWRVDDGALVASFPEDAPQAAIRGRAFVTLQTRREDWVDIVTRDFSGQETARVKLKTYPNTVLSPAGDRVASRYPPVLWNVDGQTLLSMEEWTDATQVPIEPVFTAAGDQVLLANGVFRTGDGTRTATLTPLSPLYVAQPLSLSPDGGRAIARSHGRASLFDVSAPGFTAVLGPPLGWPKAYIRTLAISADSVLVATISGVAFGIRLAPRFEDSSTAWSIAVGDTTLDGDISADGKWATAAGDNRAVFSATDGRSIWPSLPPPPGSDCFGSRLAVSPHGKWAAGGSYLGTMDVFSLADTTRPAWSLVASFPTTCWGAAAFSRDERMLATSGPELYRLDPTGTTWTPVWSHFASASPGLLSPFSGDFRNDVRYSPDETLMLVSKLDAESSSSPRSWRATLYDTATGNVARTLPELTAPMPSFSPDGSWIVAGSTLLHLPSNDTRSIDPALSIQVATFTPDGDIVGGADDGVLVRYCRDP